MNLVNLDSRIIDLDLIQKGHVKPSYSGDINYCFLKLRGIDGNIRLNENEYTKLQKIVSQQEVFKLCLIIIVQCVVESQEVITIIRQKNNVQLIKDVI